MTEPSVGLEQEETEHDVDLIHECVVKMAKEISDFMDITPDKQRMDSLMVAANIRNLSLLELFYTCVANLCKIWMSVEQKFRMNNIIILKKMIIINAFITSGIWMQLREMLL